MSSVLLLSGGVDSTAVAALERPTACLAVDYGQVTARGELAAARGVADSLGLTLDTVEVDCAAVGSGLLHGSRAASAAPSAEWWPYRNQLLVTLAAAWALPRDLDEVIVAAVATDGFHRDGQAEFFAQLDSLIAYQEGELRVSAPAIGKSTVDLVREARIGKDVLGWTFSCHRSVPACGDCPGCNKRRATFAELGL